MARIRTLKPEYWQDEKFARCDALTRLVFLGLMSQADDAGRIVDNIKLIDGVLFPETRDTCAPSLKLLARLGRILRYRSASGQQIIQIIGWTKHQRVEKPSKYTLPAPTDDDLAKLPSSAEVAQTLLTLSGGSRENRGRKKREAPAPTYDLRPTTNELNADANASGKPSSESFPQTEHDLTDGELMGLVRDHFYKPDRKAPPKYQDSREFSLFKALRNLGYSGNRIGRLIEGAAAIRDAGGLVRADLPRVDWLTDPNEKLTMRCLYNTASGVMPLAQLAEIKAAELDKKRRPTTLERGSVGAQTIMRAVGL